MNPEKQRIDAANGRRFAEFCNGDAGLFSVLKAIEKNYLETLLGSQAEEAALRELVYHRVAALRDIRKGIDAVIAVGRTAEAMIAQFEKIETKKTKKVKTHA